MRGGIDIVKNGKVIHPVKQKPEDRRFLFTIPDGIKEFQITITRRHNERAMDYIM